MLTTEQLKDLNVGDVVEVGHVLKGVTEEPLCFRVDKQHEDRPLTQFTLFYFDIPLGEWAARRQDKKVVWVDVTELKKQRKSA